MNKIIYPYSGEGEYADGWRVKVYGYSEDEVMYEFLRLQATHGELIVYYVEENMGVTNEH